MSTQENKDLSRRVMEEIWSQGNLSAVDDLYAPDLVWHGPASPTGPVRGLAGIKQFVTLNRMAFPDLRVTIEHQVAEGDRVVTRYTMQGTYQGEMQGMTPTGKQVTSTGIVIDRYADGKIVEVWNIGDAVSMLQQVPAPTKAEA
jgi:steroid delta-isomerase-like uncharacterized protein